jgi:hypothetical protein
MRNVIALILLLICFFLPLNFFIMGEGVGYGIQGVMYQYKISGYGSNLFTITQDLSYSLYGTYTGRTMVASVMWGIGSLFIVLGTVIWLLNHSGNNRYNGVSGIFIICGGISYIVSLLFQYGIFLHGDAGGSIPFGVPLVIIIGYLMIKFPLMVPERKINRIK